MLRMNPECRAKANDGRSYFSSWPLRATIVLLILLLASCGFGQSLSNLTLSPTSVTGGTSVTGTVTIAAKATGTGATVNLQDTSGYTLLPPTVTVPAGKTTATFTITTGPESENVTASIVATKGTITRVVHLVIKAAVISSVSVNPKSATGGNSVTGTVTLNAAAPAAGMVVALKSSSAACVAPATVTVAYKQTSATFNLTTKPVASITSCTLTAKLGTISTTASLKIEPPTMQGFQINPNVVVGGNHTYGIVSLTGLAPTGGIKVTMKASNKSASVLPSITLGAGTGTATFDVATSPVSVDTSCTITLTVGTTSMSQTITIKRVAISTFTISPVTVMGGNSAMATVTLNGKAGTAGFALSFSSDQTYAAVPKSATIAAGATSGTVLVTTSKVTSPSVANITVTDSAGASFKAAINVTPNGIGLATSAWPKFMHDNVNSGVGTGKGAVGNVKWKFAAQGQVASSPAIGPDGTIYFGSDDNNFYAVDGTTGKMKWKYTTGSTVDSSPSISADGSVYFGGWDGSFYSLNASTGKLNWFFPVNSYVSSGVAIAKDGTVVFGCADDNIYAVDGATGKKKWSYQTGGNVVATPVIGPDGTVYFGSNDKLVVAVDANGVQKWTFQTNGSILASPTLTSDGLLCFGSYDSNFYAVSASTGAQQWKVRLTREILSSAAVGSDGTLYFGCDDNKVYAVSSAGTVLWSVDMGSEMMTTPSISSDGTIYISDSKGFLYALNPVNGSTFWKLQLGPFGRSSVAIGADGTLYVGSSDNNLYAIN